MDLQSRFEAFVADRSLISRDDPVVVGVSGGVDSMTLLQLLVRAGFRAVAVHVNYGLRGADSDADEALVRDCCAAWGVALRVEHAAIEKGNTQDEARRIRYRAFGHVAEEVGAHTVATAHHRGDQAETLLLHLFRGTGPTGLAGLPVRRSLAPASDTEVVRPLLFASRREIEDFAMAYSIPWREDASNHDSDYQRTLLRQRVRPAIREVFGEAAWEHLAATADLMRAYLDTGAALAAERTLDALAESTETGWALGLSGLRKHTAVVRYGVYLEALRRWAPGASRSSASLHEIDELLDAQPGRRVTWAALTVWRDRDRLLFATDPVEELEPQAVTLGTTPTTEGTLYVENVERPDRFDASPHTECVDAECLQFPLLLRPWQAGDTLQPLGMEGHKNVSDLLTDRKVPPQERARQLVLVSGEEVVWVVGHRLAEPFRVGVETARTVRLTWTPRKAVDGNGGGG